MIMKMKSQFLSLSAHIGGFVSGEVRSWYMAATTLGMSPLIIIR